MVGTDAGTLAGEARRSRIDTVLHRSPVQPYFRVRAARRLPVLAYHGIDDPAAFEAQLDRLARAATPISVAHLHRSLESGSPLPPRSVLVTFDDGDRSLLTEGLPRLARRRIPAVAYVVAGLLEGDEPFWWREAAHLVAHGGTARGFQATDPGEAVRRLKAVADPDRRRILAELRVGARSQAPRQPQLTAADLAELRGGGVEVGNHSMSHALLDRCDESTVRTEVADAHKRLAELLDGDPPDSFAYPNGNHAPAAERVLGELGYRSGFLFDHRLGPRRPAHPLRISRLRVNSHTTRARFDLILSGLHSAVHRLRGGQ